jgi:alpha-tubulin suppressor-like RCC1 family protein
VGLHFHITPLSDTSCTCISEFVPKPVEALRDVRVGIIAQGGKRSYAVADTGELWAWGDDDEDIFVPLANGPQVRIPAFKPMESLQGVQVYAVAASDSQTLALADNGSVYAWGDNYEAGLALTCLSDAVSDAGEDVHTPQRISALRVACGL